MVDSWMFARMEGMRMSRVLVAAEEEGEGEERWGSWKELGGRLEG